MMRTLKPQLPHRVHEQSHPTKNTTVILTRCRCVVTACDRTGTRGLRLHVATPWPFAVQGCTASALVVCEDVHSYVAAVKLVLEDEEVRTTLSSWFIDVK